MFNFLHDLVQYLQQYLETYTYTVLFVGLFLEYIFLPFPGEYVLVVTGSYVETMQHSFVLTTLIGALGTGLGMTVQWWVGNKLGRPFFTKYGKYVGLKIENIDKVGQYFNKYGNMFMFFSLFIPGIRHFTGYFTGIIHVPYRTFAIYTYSGVFAWVFTYNMLGYIWGEKGEDYAWYIVGALVSIMVLTWIYKLIMWLIAKKKTQN